MDIDKQKISLALSGGGFKATLFHLGVVRRLMELGLFNNIKTVSSASGGSILNGLLGLHYDKIKDIDDFDKLITTKIKKIVRINVRNRLIFCSIPYLLSKWKFCKLMDKHLFDDKKLSDLSKNIKNVLNATDLNSGMRWRFNKNNFGGYDHGDCSSTDQIKISEAVYSSAAFPGLLSPFVIVKKKFKFVRRNKEEEYYNPEKIQLLDGGIYDNTGFSGLRKELENEKRFVIISDAIEIFDKKKKSFSWFNQLKRMGFIILDMKTRKDRTSLVNKLIKLKKDDGSYENSKLNGIIFLIKNNCKHYRNYEDNRYYIPPTKDNIPSDIGWDEHIVSQLAHMRTDFEVFHKIEIDYLMYHGASLLDVNLRKWHPEIYKELPNIPLMRPDYNDKKVNKILSRSHKHYLFNFIRYL
ncbi:MAG: patatin-like phospholipase family protein [Bacteroidales bacterium]|nr:patatin-like phospholipase family protein [Bacteroidales bacterium]